MTHHHINTKEFVVGAVIGSLLGGVAAFLAAPTTGKKLRGDIYDAYHHLSDETEDLIEKGRSVAKNMRSQTSDWANRAKSAANGASKIIRGWGVKETEKNHSSKELLIGGLIGGVAGVALALLLTPKSGEDLRHNIADAYDDIGEMTHKFAKKGKSFAKATRSQANKWLTLAQGVVHGLSEDVQDKGEDLIDQLKDLANHPRIAEVLDWAQLGYRAWNGLRGSKQKKK